MKIPELCIKRPVLASVLSLVVLLLGIISYDRLPVREYPNIDEPVVTVETTYRGASAEIMETQVSQILEESIAGIEGIEVVSSISREEKSQITVRFKVSRNIEDAANDVRDRVGRVRDVLPDEVDEPIVAKTEADAQPVIYISFSSSKHDAMEVTDYADRYIKDKLQTLTGVANVIILGGREYSMRIRLDRARLAAYNLTVQDIENALRAQNVEIPAGRIESSDREFTVLSETDLKTPEQFGQMIIRDNGGYLIRLSDVSRVETAPRDERTYLRFNGQPAVGMGVVKQSVANPLDISRELNEIIPKISKGLPEGMKLDIAYDSSIFISRSIDGVFEAIRDAVILVIIVIFIFLRSWRATLIPLVTIPVSLIGAFAVMFAMDFSINTLTLLAMVLAVGLVVDDAIVMLENIHRHIEDGMKPLPAAIKGSGEIAFAVLAMTVTLAAVYAPMGFMEGRTGRLFTEFALTLAAAVMVSGYVAMTLTPMMCSRMLHHETKHGFLFNIIEKFLNGINSGYKFILSGMLNYLRPLVIIGGLAVAGAGGWLFMHIPSELAPTEDRGTIMGIGIAPEGSTPEYTDRYMKQLEGIYKTVPEIKHYFVVTGFPQVTQGISFARMSDWSERTRKQQEVVGQLMPMIFGGIPGIMAFPLNPPSLGQNMGQKPVQFVLQTNSSYEELQKYAEQLLAVMQQNPLFFTPDSDLKMNKPRLRVDIDREKAALMGIDVATVGRTLETMLGGRQVTRFKKDGQQYDVMVQIEDAERQSPDDINNIFVRSASGSMVPLSNIVSMHETVAPKELNRFNRMHSATISANPAPGVTLGQALEFLEAKAAEILPSSVQTDYDGQSREFKQSSTSLYVTFLLALVFIYLVLAAQFESFTDPFIIMLSVPLSVTGALAAMYMTGVTMNVYSQIGLITLIGLITKHGIMIVEVANQIQETGVHRIEAAIQAAVMRLRPILMTTGATVLGAVPLAIAHGAGAESRMAIGWVIVGGMTVGTLFTLFVIPTVYTYLARRKWHDAADWEEQSRAAE